MKNEWIDSSYQIKLFLFLSNVFSQIRSVIMYDELKIFNRNSFQDLNIRSIFINFKEIMEAKLSMPIFHYVTKA
jgi:hypothetical protein